MEQSTLKTGIIIPPSSVEGGESVAAIFASIAGIINDAYQKAAKAWEKGNLDYNRGARLHALQRRRQWKEADRPRLQALGIPSPSIERHIGAKRLGRPVVKEYKPLILVLGSIFIEVLTLADRKTKPHERLMILKRSPMWPYFVEALYRGECESVKTRRLRSPSIETENIVGKALNISPELVHKLRGEVRRHRKKAATLVDCRAITVAEFEVWRQTGSFRDDPVTVNEKMLPRLISAASPIAGL